MPIFLAHKQIPEKCRKINIGRGMAQWLQILTCVTVEVGMASRGGRGGSSASGPRTARACPAPAQRSLELPSIALTVTGPSLLVESTN